MGMNTPAPPAPPAPLNVPPSADGGTAAAGAVDAMKIYGIGDAQVRALDGVTVSFETGKFTAIMGPSGCGKSTLLNTLGTVDRPSAGRYLFGEQDLATLDEAALARFRSATLGFVFQSFNLIDELTIAENVALGLAYRTMPAREKKERVAAAMDRVGIAHRQRHHPHQLSGGQQQRAAIARIVDGGTGNVLLYGATGSGKTEVYLQACATMLERGFGTIILVPEIALAPQTVGRVRARFGDRVAILHSALTDAERRDERERIAAASHH